MMTDRHFKKRSFRTYITVKLCNNDIEAQAEIKKPFVPIEQYQQNISAKNNLTTSITKKS
jgi:hypothetical protein